MYDYARKLDRSTFTSYERFVGKVREHEAKIKKEGFKLFTLYVEEPVNYWEVYSRIVEKLL